MEDKCENCRQALLNQELNKKVETIEIVKAITGQVVVKTTTPQAVEKVFDTTIPVASNITPFNGGTGYIESLDNRLVIHLDRYTYISMMNEGQESHIDLYTRQENKRLL